MTWFYISIMFTNREMTGDQVFDSKKDFAPDFQFCFVFRSTVKNTEMLDVSWRIMQFMYMCIVRNR